jgi:hypothetical protein
MTILSALRSSILIFFPYSTNYFDLFLNNHPTCAKKNPYFIEWGSNSVSENLWWSLWSRLQWKIEPWFAPFLKNYKLPELKSIKINLNIAEAS